MCIRDRSTWESLKIQFQYPMSDFNSEERVKKMIEAINLEADEKVNQIKEYGLQLFKIEKNKLITIGKDKINDEYKHKFEDYFVKQRIQKSSRINEIRIQKMNIRFELLTKLEEELIVSLKKKLQNEQAYKKFLKLLIIESLIKLMEENVELICLQQDVKLIKSIIPEAEKEFTNLIQKECKGRVINPKILISERKQLETIEKNSIGGIILTCNRGKIVCANTLLNSCLLYTSDAADEEDSVDLGGRRTIKKKKKKYKKHR
eukprot:TRINITY_DN940_c0_g1_i3.p1 TRINITY_DN940_c0_g1~~TRINITY_DN940_c0_g1_i3.p1  ORF type:complete len:306 (-),score=57.26 TRINITY_DN940_c0_g1_i3:43-825(-)